MSRVLALVEGKTEQAFVDQVLRPELKPAGVYIRATLFGKPGHKRGGIRRYQSIRRDILSALREDRERFCTTMVDYYKLPKDWPDVAKAKGIPATERAPHIERAVSADICSELGPSFDGRRFVAYVQMYEFESLLFSDPGVIAKHLRQPALAPALESVLREFGSPEQIGDRETTAPSKRLAMVAPYFQKLSDAPIIAQRIGLARMRERCPHFHGWLQRLEALVQHGSP